MFKIDKTIKYTEINEHGVVDISTIIDFFQNTSIEHSESLGIGIEYLADRQLAWVLSSWQIDIDRDIEFNENIKVGTMAYDFKSFYGYRNFFVEDENGNMPIKANSVWVLLDLKTGMPTKVTDNEAKPYGKHEKLNMEYAQKKVKLPECDGERKEAFTVPRYSIDTNGHMNNSWYVKFAAEYLNEDTDINMLRVEYKYSAKYGNVITPVVYLEDGKTIVSLNSEEDRPYAIVEFTQKRK